MLNGVLGVLRAMSRPFDSDPNLRVILKDLPVLGPDSRDAAKVSTAVRKLLSPKNFWTFHKALLSSKDHIGKAEALKVAKSHGADMAIVQREMDSQATTDAMNEVANLADTLKFHGTPAWVIGSSRLGGTIIDGARPVDDFKSKINSFRNCGKAACPNGP